LYLNSPGLVDAVNFVEAGYIVARNDYLGVFEAMLDLSNNKNKYKKMKVDVYAFSHKFNWEFTGREFTKILLELSMPKHGK